MDTKPEKTTMTERGHHKYSPSKLQALEACPGFEGEDTTSAASSAGVLQHDATETLVRTGVIVDPRLDDEQIEVVKNCGAFVDEQFKELGEGAALILEEYLPIDAQATTAGYLDVGMVSKDGKKGKIIDYKFGLNPVEDTATNLQGIAYLLGILLKYPLLEQCEVLFVMPYQGDGGIIDGHLFKKHEFDGMRLRIETIVARAKKAYADFESGDIERNWSTQLKATTSGCLFCARKAACPALRQLVIQASKKYDPLLVPDQINPMLIKSPNDAGRGLQFFAVLEALARAYRSKCTEKTLNEEGWCPEGYQPVTMVRRSIVDKVRFAETITPLLTKEEFMNCIDFTLGPIEKAISAKAPRGQKKAAVQELSDLLNANGATQEGEPILILKKSKVAGEVEALPA